MIRIRVSGTPAPQGSKSRGRNGGLYESAKGLKPWREAVRSETQTVMAIRANGERPYRCPVSVALIFAIARPKGHYGTGRNAGTVRESAPRYPGSNGRLDVDKLARAVLDGLTDGGVWADDAQVVDLHVCKIWAPPDGSPGVDITIREMA